MKTGNPELSTRSTGAVAEQVIDALGGADGSDCLAVAAVPITIGTPEALLTVPSAWESTVLWHRPGGGFWCGVGVAAEIVGDGPDRFNVVRERARQLWSRVRVRPVADTRITPPAPRLLGGAAFASGTGSDALWSELGDARFVLPTFTAVQRGRDGWLLVAAREGSTPAERGELAATAEHLVAELRTATLRELAAPRLLRRRDSEPDRWQQGVAAICTAIAAGELKKVVTARSSDLELDREIALDQVLDRLAHECPECTRFLVRRRGVAFVGATPERLVSRRGRRVTSEALAGSMPIATGAGEGSPHERLLACAKNRGEHQLVVDSIREALAPLCVSLDVAEAPSVVALRHVLHLSSPFSGMLADDTHVLELVDALHPTPAVGGAPKVAALRWIAENEPLDRGWYAGPVGWFDGSGDGDLAVAIRSALVHGASARVFAGAGVVAGSEPSSELRETVLKQRAMVHGLGLEWECDGCFGPS